jgi:glucose/arabinose dehydrogenase
MIGAVSHALGAVALGLLLAAQVSETQACREERVPVDNTLPSPGPTPSPTPSPTPTPGAEVFVTEDGVRFRVDVLVSNVEIPWSMAFAPDGRLFITERPGRVRILTLATNMSELALTLDDTFLQGEAGALGLTLDPEFGQNRLVYLYYTARSGSGGVNRLVRYREVGGRLAERAVLLDNVPANTIHDGGRIRFGPDGLLYVTTGDASAQSLAQDVASLAGKILRLNRDGTTPGGNPFGSPVYSVGHRNPQGLDWHPVTGALWASEHGSTGNDEINVIRSGANYGWPRIQGAMSLAGMETPIATFDPAIAPSGASFYRGRLFPQFENNLFVATLRGSHILRLRFDSASPTRIAAQERLLDQRYGRIRDVVSGPDGFIYFATNNRDGRGSPVASDDRIARLVPAP